jgi:hypothetical protein
MKISFSMIMMFVGSFVIQYLFMPPIMVNQYSDITNNIGKVYLSTIMGLFMIVLDIMIHDHHYHVFSLHMYLLFGVTLAIFIYLYKKQVAIKDDEYVKGMIEHHSMALLTSEEILKKTDNYDIAKLAKQIIQTQTDEIRTMKELLRKE